MNKGCLIMTVPVIVISLVPAVVVLSRIPYIGWILAGSVVICVGGLMYLLLSANDQESSGP